MYIADHSDSIVFRLIAIAIPLDSDKCRFLSLILIRIRLHFFLSQKSATGRAVLAICTEYSVRSVDMLWTGTS